MYRDSVYNVSRRRRGETRETKRGRVWDTIGGNNSRGQTTMGIHTEPCKRREGGNEYATGNSKGEFGRDAERKIKKTVQNQSAMRPEPLMSEQTTPLPPFPAGD